MVTSHQVGDIVNLLSPLVFIQLEWNSRMGTSSCYIIANDRKLRRG